VAIVKATLLNQRADTAPLAPEILALVHIASTITDALFGKISLTAAIRANWHMKFQNAQYPLDSVKLEVGYPDSQGIMTFRNSGTLMGPTRSDLMMPLIWSEANQQQIFQIEFLKGTVDAISMRYKTLFKISPALPAGFNDAFVGTEKVPLAIQPQEFTLNVFLQ
jgi:hypothetical protein